MKGRTRGGLWRATIEYISPHDIHFSLLAESADLTLRSFLLGRRQTAPTVSEIQIW